MEMEAVPDIYVDESFKELPPLAHIDGTRITMFGKSITQVKAIFKEIEDFEVFDGEIIVSSYPKSGTTWVQEIVWQIMKDPEDEGSKLRMDEKFPYLEYPYPGLDEIKRRPTPRIIKTHLHYRHLPLNLRQGHGKLIYIARNPKDVCVSVYHFLKFRYFTEYKGDFESLSRVFINRQDPFGPWEDHVKDYWMHRNDENVLFITYEDMKEDVHGVIRQIAGFLGREISDRQVTKIAQSTKFESMKSNPLLNYSWFKGEEAEKNDLHFLRKGTVGDWKNYFTPEMENEFETKLLSPLKSIGLNFKDS